MVQCASAVEHVIDLVHKNDDPSFILMEIVTRILNLPPTVVEVTKVTHGVE